MSGDCWDDVFELGRDPHAIGYPYTWFDFVAVVRGSAESAFIRRVVAASPIGQRAKMAAAAKLDK